MLLMTIEIEMIAGKQEPLVEEQDTVARRMTWSRNGDDVPRHFHGRIAFQNDLCCGLRWQFVSMNESPAAEVMGVSLRVGDIVLMSQEDVGDSTEGLELSDELRQKLG